MSFLIPNIRPFNEARANLASAQVTANQIDPLAIIQRLDPIFGDIQQSSADPLELRRALAGGGAIFPTNIRQERAANLITLFRVMGGDRAVGEAGTTDGGE